MRRVLLAVLGVSVSIGALAHVSPNVTLIRRGDFVRQALAGATKFFEKTLDPAAIASVRHATGWTPSSEDVKVYVGRDDAGHLVGMAVFVWMPSQHGPVGLGVAFGPDGGVLQATVTDVGTEPLVWVRPLLRDGRISGLEALSGAPDPSRIAPDVSGSMSRYYARVIAEGIARGQAMQRASGVL
jgi:hypothetical protein